ncbi:hypothetical protein FIBSPDRAFT_903062 [Athelia psychrophila]|uniref:Uncharacterized protein n=1 Tax=Athelia psychrophila TaxID=1759441 RepID=A0A167WGL6_9AGAM|nr:hypothetical protein FIBSPDRAFT_903062 [Fibularhizoctonia sp. CBS 109695]
MGPRAGGSIEAGLRSAARDDRDVIREPEYRWIKNGPDFLLDLKCSRGSSSGPKMRNHLQTPFRATYRTTWAGSSHVPVTFTVPFILTAYPTSDKYSGSSPMQLLLLRRDCSSPSAPDLRDVRSGVSHTDSLTNIDFPNYYYFSFNFLYSNFQETGSFAAVPSVLSFLAFGGPSNTFTQDMKIGKFALATGMNENYVGLPLDKSLAKVSNVVARDHLGGRHVVTIIYGNNVKRQSLDVRNRCRASIFEFPWLFSLAQAERRTLNCV